MKSQMSNMINLNSRLVDNEDPFKRDVLAIIGSKLVDMSIPASLSDRKFINNLITAEYFQQRNYL